MEMRYFKRNYASGNHEWTEYGGYEDSDITPLGDIDTVVYSIDCKDGKYCYELYENFIDLDEITEITEDEYRLVVKRLQKVDELQAQIDAVLKALI